MGQQKMGVNKFWFGKIQFSQLIRDKIDCVAMPGYSASEPALARVGRDRLPARAPEYFRKSRRFR